MPPHRSPALLGTSPQGDREQGNGNTAKGSGCEVRLEEKRCWEWAGLEATLWDQLGVPAGDSHSRLEYLHAGAQAFRAFGDAFGLPSPFSNKGLPCPNEHSVEIWDALRHLKQQHAYLGTSRLGLLVLPTSSISVQELNPILFFLHAQTRTRRCCRKHSFGHFGLANVQETQSKPQSRKQGADGLAKYNHSSRKKAQTLSEGPRLSLNSAPESMGGVEAPGGGAQGC